MGRGARPRDPSVWGFPHLGPRGAVVAGTTARALFGLVTTTPPASGLPASTKTTLTVRVLWEAQGKNQFVWIGWHSWHTERVPLLARYIGGTIILSRHYYFVAVHQ